MDGHVVDLEGGTTRIFPDNKENGFIGQLINGGAVRLVQVVMMFLLGVYLLLAVHQFFIFQAQEVGDIEVARQRWEINCAKQDVKKAKLFYNDCKNDGRDKEKSAWWEALARMARRQRICGESDCSSAIYFVAGMVVGCIVLILVLPRLQKICMFGVARINETHMDAYRDETPWWTPFRNSEGKKWK